MLDAYWWKSSALILKEHEKYLGYSVKLSETLCDVLKFNEKILALLFLNLLNRYFLDLGYTFVKL